MGIINKKSNISEVEEKSTPDYCCAGKYSNEHAVPDIRPSHITFIVKDIERSKSFLESIFGAQEVYESGENTFSLSKEKFFLINEQWICVMEGDPHAERTYDHIAFQVNENELDEYIKRITDAGAEIKPGRPRVDGEGRSIYFYDYDNHLFELHTGTLRERLRCYLKAGAVKQEVVLNRLTEHSTLDEIQEYIDTVVRMRGFADQPIQETMLLLLEETGELAKAIRKTSTRMSVDVDKMQSYDTVESEVADVFFVLTAVCNQLGVNLLEALKDKEKKNCKRNWSFDR